MKPRNLKFKCPDKIKANQKVINPENPRQSIVLLGFVGTKGYRYHPTKGLRKVAGFVPSEHQIKQQ